MKPDETTEQILDNLGTIIAELERKNENVAVKVCGLAPSGKSNDLNERINEYNTKLLNWCNNNGVTFIETEKFFKLGTGEIDFNCYENLEENESCDVFSRIGAIQLLDAISSMSQNIVCCKWDDVKKNYFSRERNSKISFSMNERGEGSREVDIATPRDSNDRPINTRFSKINSRSNNYFHSQSHSNSGFNSKLNRIGHNNRNVWRGNRPNNLNNNQYFRRDTASSNDRTRVGCYNCGEYNHRQSNCRFDHMIKCSICHEFGHKSRLCNNSPH